MRDADYKPKAPTLTARLRCFVTGHDVREWGSMFGWCHRCRHSVHNYGSRRRVLYYGEYYSFPPQTNRRIAWSAYSDEELGITNEPPTPGSGKIVRW